MRKVYLDNCCYNRPYDDQSRLRISLETQAKLYVQRLIKTDALCLVSSYILLYEAKCNPHKSAKDAIMIFIRRYSSIYVDASNNNATEDIAHEIQQTGVKKMDALHLACAILAEADYFLTTDDRLLKYSDSRIRVLNPILFLNELEENYE